MKWGEGTKKIYEKNQRRWEEVPKKTMGGGTKKNLEARLPTTPLGVEIVCENNMRRRLSERIPLKKT